LAERYRVRRGDHRRDAGRRVAEQVGEPVHGVDAERVADVEDRDGVVAAGVGGDTVDVLRREARVAERGEAGVDGEPARGSVDVATDLAVPDAGDRHVPHERLRNRGRVTSSATCSNVTSTGM